MPNLFSLGAVCLGAASRILKSKFEKTAAAVVVGVVGIGLLSGSLSLFAEPIGVGRGVDNPPFENVCAPVVHYVEVTNDGSAGFRVSVSLASHGWDMFRRRYWSDGSLRSKGYYFRSYNAVRHYPLRRGKFSGRFYGTVLKTWDDDDYHVPVHFDYFARGGTGGKYFEMRIDPEENQLKHVRDKHYYPGDHWVNITLYVTDRDSKGNRLPNGGYKMHCWVSDNDGNGYYVTVYLDNNGDGTFEQAF